MLLESKSRVSISVIVPVYKAARWIRRCLQSLVDQDFSEDHFEIILVFNGPKDSSEFIAEEFAKKNVNHRFVLITSDATSAAEARNVGLKSASGTHVTWVDADDAISGNYLKSLAYSVSSGVVPVAQLANVGEDGRVDRDNIINRDLLSLEKPIVSPAEFMRATTFMTAKLIPIEWAKANPFDQSLASGEDVAFYGRLLSQYVFQLSGTPGMAGATYFRQLVAKSVSRGRSDISFMVTERALVIRSLLESLTQCKTANSKIINSYIGSQLSFIIRYIKENPLQKTEVVDRLTALKIHGFPWKKLQAEVDSLAICYNFAPHSDTGANVASKRMRETGHIYDVISNGMSSVRETHPENWTLVAPYVALHRQIDAPTTFANPHGIASFVSEGYKTYEKFVSIGRKYKRLYSRSMWPASHFLAAMIRQKNSSIFWTAEFSDPVRLNTEGVMRTAPLQSEKLLSLLTDGFESVQILLDDMDIYSWTENLPYLFADELLFTNENQLEVMLSYAPDSLRDSILRRAVIKRHPTLPPLFYNLGSSQVELIQETVNIGYFGEFYSTRGLSEILDAIDCIPNEMRDKINLHIYSSSKFDLENSRPSSSRVSFYPKLSYFDFLSTLDDFDALLVNDASTSGHHPINPYLPSKYSDYLGSAAEIWSLTEPNSVLSKMHTRYQSTLGDIEGAVRVLKEIVLSKFDLML